VSAAVHGVHHHGILLVVTLGVVDDQHALLVKAPGHAAGGAQVAAELVKVVAHAAGGTLPVVGHGLHNHSHTAGAVAFVGDGFVVVAAACAGSPLQYPLDVVVGHIGGLGLGDDGGKTGVVGGIDGAAALFDCHNHFLCDFGEGGSTFGVL